MLFFVYVLFQQFIPYSQRRCRYNVCAMATTQPGEGDMGWSRPEQHRGKATYNKLTPCFQIEFLHTENYGCLSVRGVYTNLFKGTIFIHNIVDVKTNWRFVPPKSP